MHLERIQLRYITLLLFTRRVLLTGTGSYLSKISTTFPIRSSIEFVDKIFTILLQNDRSGCTIKTTDLCVIRALCVGAGILFGVAKNRIEEENRRMETGDETKRLNWWEMDMKPNDGREWKTVLEVALKLDITHQAVYNLIARQGWTTARKRPYRMWILKADVDWYIEFHRLRDRWYRRHRRKGWKPEIAIIEDKELLRRVFWTASQAALYMGVSRNTVYVWGRKAKSPYS